MCVDAVPLGLRPVHSHPPLFSQTGIAWAAATGSHDSLRHSCRHEHKLQQWGWQAFDASGGVEEIGDAASNVTLTIHWDTAPPPFEGSHAAATATVRIDHSPAATRRRRKLVSAGQQPEPTVVSVFAYLSGGADTLVSVDGPLLKSGPVHGGPGPTLTLATAATSDVDEMPRGMLTHAPRAGGEGEGPSLGCSTCRASLVASVGEAWDVEDVLKRALGRSARSAIAGILAARDGQAAAGQPLDWSRGLIVPLLNGTTPRAGKRANVAVLQFVRSVPFTLSLVYDRVGGAPGSTAAAHATALAAAPGIALRAAAEERKERFRSKMCTQLGICASASASAGENATAAASAAALANLLGSVTYFHGPQLVGPPSEPMTGSGAGRRDIRSSPAHGLLTGVPSRSFFPRGFLWDEGFHQLILSAWQPATSRAVLSSWLGTMDGAGWIAREQILGAEARSRVPEQFRVQRPDIPNPPAIVLPIMALVVRGLCRMGSAIEAVVGSDGQVAPVPVQSPAVAAFCAARSLSSSCKYACEEGGASGGEAAPSDAAPTLSWLATVVPALARHYAWFQRTQAGSLPLSFRWRGATQDHNFASGLDDYPRGVEPHATDRNVDLLSWMALFAEVLSELQGLVGDEGAASRARADAAAYTAALEGYWSEGEGLYCDWGVTGRKAQEGGVGKGGKAPTPMLVHGPVCHEGYVSLMPLITRRLRADSPHMGALLERMADPKGLSSPRGLRSLSAASPLYGSGENYWRGAVWVNLNWMVAAALRHYGALPGPYAERAAALAIDLRGRLVEAVGREYGKRGFLFESFDADTGAGKGTHPFTGWTALVSLLAADVWPF
jgi:mannosyl-oligosaccharide glucosidase